VRLLQQVTKKMCDLWENKTGKYIHLSIYLPTYLLIYLICLSNLI
jgi:hypothetical protein